jgi:hypothetical protein
MKDFQFFHNEILISNFQIKILIIIKKENNISDHGSWTNNADELINHCVIIIVNDNGFTRINITTFLLKFRWDIFKKFY